MPEQLQIDFDGDERIVPVSAELAAEQRDEALERSLQINPVNALMARLQTDPNQTRASMQLVLDSVSPNARTRFEAEHAADMPDQDLVKPSTGPGNPPAPPPHVRSPRYFRRGKSGEVGDSIRNNRLSSKEKGMADSPTVPQDFQKF